MNLEPDLYAVAKSLSKAEDCSISSAVNRLLRRSIQRGQPARESQWLAKRNGFVISHGKRPITADLVRRLEAEDD